MMLNVLSFGGGVQSTVLLLMSCLGELPKLDHAIFSDPGWESPATYKHVEWCRQQSDKAGIPLHILTGKDIKQDALISKVRGIKGDGERWASMPYYTRNRKTGEVGMIKRQCTNEYKIQPVEKYIRSKILELKKGQRAKPRAINLWIGYSVDEMRRVRASRNRWCVNQYPLIFKNSETLEFATPQMSREDCRQWLRCRYKGLAVPSSQCVGCPFMDDLYWIDLRENQPSQWDEVCRFDEAIRECGGDWGDVFIHQSATPLRTAKLNPNKPKMYIADMFGGFSCGTCDT